MYRSLQAYMHMLARADQNQNGDWNAKLNCQQLDPNRQCAALANDQHHES